MGAVVYIAITVTGTYVWRRAAAIHTLFSTQRQACPSFFAFRISFIASANIRGCADSIYAPFGTFG
jgi:hypothetical protein